MDPLMCDDHELRVRVERRSEMDALLDQAVESLIGSAIAYGDRGIRVVRHSPHDFTVKLDCRVPYGLCYEERVW